MDFTEYRQRGKEMVDYIADYLENIRDRKVYPDVKPGYMKNLLPDSAPIEGEQWDSIFGDVERVIMPGITHWQSPHMHAYFPALNSFPSLMGDMLADAINCIGFTWASSPACTELEIIVMNWLGKMINLPDDFLHLSSASRGGGVIQTTASEATLVCLLAGRTRAIQRFHEKRPGYQDAEINARLVAYCSDQAHSSVEKAALIGLVRMRYIEADENLSMRGQPLRDAIEDDIRQGLVPFWVCATLGTTGSCSFDNLEEIGIVCREFNLWLHVDAAYAGSAFICPEFRTWLKGIERADSIAFNPSKWLMIHFDATALWVKDSTAVHRTFNVEPLYLQHENSGVAVDFMHWQIPLSRRFRALKIWFVLRSYGIKGLQKHIREGVRLAQKFEALVSADHRFEIPAKRHLGLVVFRIKGDNEITERLLKRLNHRGNLHCIPSSLKGKYVIRFTVTSTRTTVDDILKDWMEIKNAATSILDEMNITISNRVYLKDTKEKCEAFGSSLLLSNSPLSPKIVNGSFAALFDADEFLAKTYAGIRIAHQESPNMRRRVRGILMSGKQFSLDSHMDVVVQTSMDSSTTNSKVIDSYGKTTSSVKNKERDSIREDEESLEDCEMRWQLKTARQLQNQLNKNYPTVLKKPRPPKPPLPIDIIHPPNNLFTKYDENLTRSVNSVKTPLTQYQLFKNPRQLSAIRENRYDYIEQTEQSHNISAIYPGKRYLESEISLQNGYPFTDTIFNLPSPTEEIIPIIITPGTPTSGPTTVVNNTETDDFNKAVLKIPTTISLLPNKPDDGNKTVLKISSTSGFVLNKPEVSKKATLKSIATTSMIINRPEISRKIVTKTPSLILNKSDISKRTVPKNPSPVLNKPGDFYKTAPTPSILNKSDNSNQTVTTPPSILNKSDDSYQTITTPSPILNETNDSDKAAAKTPCPTSLNLNNPEDSKKSAVPSPATLILKTSEESKQSTLQETPAVTTSIIPDKTDVSKKPIPQPRIKTNLVVRKADEDLVNINSQTPSTSNTNINEDIDDDDTQPLLKTPTTSINVNDEVANVTKIIPNQPKGKSKDDSLSSSEDESSASFSQPSSDVEGSSTQASSLESV